MTVATTTSGDVRGAAHRGVVRFAGIPFAAPPVGPNRFRPPRPAEPWDGVRDAVEPGPVSIQNPMVLDQMLGVDPEPQDEDCLYLNVFTPAVDDARRPVLVWVHGGAFIMGSGSSPMYDSSELVTRGDVVVVTVNYRLGALGFLELGTLAPEYEGSGNNGILDQIAALEWVADNIAAFGGDPDNVTVFGESAGAMSVSTLLGAPRAKGLFHKAIAQSGAAHNSSSPEQAAEVLDRFMTMVGASSLEELLALETEKILEAQLTFLVDAFTTTDAQLSEGEPVRIPFQPVHGVDSLPRPAIEAVAAGSAAEVALVVGTTRDEWNLFSFLDQEAVDEALLLDRLRKVTGDGEGAMAVYEEAVPDATPKERFNQAVTDYVFRQPAIRLAEHQAAQGAPVHMYLFTWSSSALGGSLGSCHALDVPFVFGNLDQPGIAMLLGGDAPEPLRDSMMDAWVAFARTGDPAHEGLPAWPAYRPPTRSTLVLGDECHVVDDPEAARRQFWDTRL